MLFIRTGETQYGLRAEKQRGEFFMKLSMIVVLAGLVAAVFAVCPVMGPCSVSAEQSGSPEAEQKGTKGGSEDEIKEKIEDKVEQFRRDADAFFEQGGLEDIKKVIELYEKILEQNPGDFEATWKIARACRGYGDLVKRKKVPGWEDLCAQYGKKGMEYAKKAIEMAPDKPNGYYYYGLCVGTYSDGVGLFTALREGLKDKTRNSLEKAYEIDKYFEEGGPIVALGRFWQVVPWPYTDEDKAMQYYREFQKTKYFDTPGAVNAHVYMAELLMDQWGSEPEKEARKLLKEAIELTEDPYWKKRSRELLDQL